MILLLQNIVISLNQNRWNSSCSDVHNDRQARTGKLDKRNPLRNLEAEEKEQIDGNVAEKERGG
jgi:hypothetical protein